MFITHNYDRRFLKAIKGVPVWRLLQFTFHVILHHHQDTNERGSVTNTQYGSLFAWPQCFVSSSTKTGIISNVYIQHFHGSRVLHLCFQAKHQAGNFKLLTL